jgi:glycosyltransferase involved in cell wall biosynthesis
VAALDLTSYRSGSSPTAGSVPLTVIILTKNEAVNIERCIASAGWASQIVVVDSESTDDTVHRAASAGADVVVEPWRGFGAQREFALRLPLIEHDWVYFADADEWFSEPLAAEVSTAIQNSGFDAYTQRLRLVFLGRWIRHCGWYRGSWVVRLMRRSKAYYSIESTGERARVESVGTLKNDIIDDDRKGLATWLHKHVKYAELEADRAAPAMSFRSRWRAFQSRGTSDTRPVARAIAKDLLLPHIPGKPLAIFLYMFVFRLGFLDGKTGLIFCLYHAWYRLTIDALQQPEARRHYAAIPQQG